MIQEKIPDALPAVVVVFVVVWYGGWCITDAAAMQPMTRKQTSSGMTFKCLGCLLLGVSAPSSGGCAHLFASVQVGIDAEGQKRATVRHLLGETRRKSLEVRLCLKSHYLNLCGCIWWIPV